jgi:tellurite resistance protein
VGARDVDVGESEAEERDVGAQVASVLGAMGLDYVDLSRCL